MEYIALCLSNTQKQIVYYPSNTATFLSMWLQVHASVAYEKHRAFNTTNFKVR